MGDTYLLKTWRFCKTVFWKGKNDLAASLEYSNVATKAQHTPKELGPPCLSSRILRSYQDY